MVKKLGEGGGVFGSRKAEGGGELKVALEGGKEKGERGRRKMGR